MPKLEELLLGGESDPAFLAFALAAAFLLGAAHALTPGHGKTVVAAYLMGSRGRIADAVYLGLVVTATHTASVFVLGIATLYAAQRLPMETIFPVLSLASGAMVAVVGAWLLWQRTRPPAAEDPSRPANHAHHHAHHRGHHHGHHHGHSHGDTSRGGLLSLGISGGMVPCPEALVVLLLAVSIGRIALGLALLTAFSIGLAAILIAIGCAMVMAGPAIERVARGGFLERRLPAISAAVVTLLGVAMVVEAARTL
jgi:ABC-type nickel/cobalt efflux system permease component RcnA